MCAPSEIPNVSNSSWCWQPKEASKKQQLWTETYKAESMQNELV